MSLLQYYHNSPLLQAVGYMQSIGSSVKKSSYTTLYDYTAQNATQLSFKQGETVRVCGRVCVKCEEGV